jgi:uncharacterized protein (TIGR02118 family)
MVVKQVTFFKRKPGISPVDFQKHWRTTHAGLVVALPGLRRYVQNHSEPNGDREPPFDGVAEAWFDDVDAMRAIVDSSELRAIREDEPNFIDGESMGTILVDEVVIKDGEPRPEHLKLIAFVRKQDTLEPETFQRMWREELGVIAAELPGWERYVQNHSRLGIYRSGRTPVYDGCAMVWALPRAFAEAMASEAMTRARDYEKGLFNVDEIALAYTRPLEIPV